MIKRVVLGLLVLAALTGAAWAQGSKFAVSLDAAPLVKGFIWGDSDAKNSQFALSPGVEFLMAPHFTLGGVVDLWFGKNANVSVSYMALTAHGRWYPLSAGLDKLFVDAGLGFNRFAYDGESDPAKGGMTGLTFSLKMGYKLMFSKFFVEPSMAFVYAKTPSSSTFPTPLGWQPGLALGMVF
ncbi:MAG: hypothetical protein LBG84_05850 [Treponema sp.]|jgi:hypothetical protein|nr:hypothetical protein [Treponema sp.]